MKLLLFDLDGTLLLTGGAGMRAMTRAGVLVCGERFSLEGTMVAGGLDPQIFAHAATNAGVENAEALHETFYATYLRELPRELEASRDRIEVMPGILPLLEQLRRREDITLGLLTGNYRQSSPLKLQAAGLAPSWFKVSAFGDEAPDRPAMGHLARQRFEAMLGRPADDGDIIIIGDTPRDVDCAKANGWRSFSVATGRYSVSDLQEAGADVAVDDLSDPQPLYDLIDSPAVPPDPTRPE